MGEEYETVELEYSEDDVLYYIEDEDGVEIGFALEEDGAEVEYYYEGFDADEYEVASLPASVGSRDAASLPESVGSRDAASLPASVGSHDAALPRIAADLSETADGKPQAPADDGPDEHGYLYKMAAIVGHEGKKKRKAAEVKLEVARGKAEKHYDKAKKAATEKATQAKAKADDLDLGITREDVTETTADLNAIAKEGAETVKELKEAYDDIMDNFGFLIPKSARRRLP